MDNSFSTIPCPIPFYGKFDLNTYLPGYSDYEIMCYLVQKYNELVKYVVGLPISTIKIGTPEMYGAKGDGVTDDSEAILKCITENDISFFKPNTYNLKKNIEISNASNKIIIGNYCTFTSTLIPDTTTNTNLIYAFIFNNCTNIHFSYANFTKVFTSARFNNCTNISFVYINLSTYRFGCEFFKCRNFIIENIYIENQQKFTNAAGDFIYTDGVHIGGDSHYGKVNNIRGTSGDDLIALVCGELAEYGSSGDITNITISNVFSETKNILTSNPIYYPDSAFRLVDITDPTRRYKVSNILISNVNGSSYYAGALTLDADGDNITITDCNISKTPSGYYERPTLEIGGAIDKLTINNCTITSKITSVFRLINFEGVTSKSVTLTNCTIGDGTGTQFAFIMKNAISIDTLKIDNCNFNVTNFCNALNATLQINTYQLTNSHIHLTSTDYNLTDFTIGIYGDTSLHGDLSIISNITAKCEPPLIYIGDKAKTLIISNIINNNSHLYSVFINNNNATNCDINVSNYTCNQIPVTISTSSNTRLVTHGAPLNTSPAAFTSSAKKGDIVETVNGVFYFNGTEFVLLNS